MTRTASALDTEWSLLRAATTENLSDEQINIRALLSSPINWPELFAIADQHALQSLLYQTLLKFQDAVPPAEMNALRGMYTANLHKSLLLSREMIGIIDCLRASNIEVLPYKGPALAEALYGDIALRQAGDIDLLIRQADLPRIRQVVGTLSYIPHHTLSRAEEDAYVHSGYECAFDGPAGPNLLEVQWALQPRFYAVEFEMEGLFSRAVAASVTGYPIRIPSPEDLFIVLSLHAAKHVWNRLIWLADIARLLPRRELNWAWIASQAVDLGIVRILRVTALLAQNLLRASIPEEMAVHIPADREADDLAREIELQIRSRSEINVESFEYFRLMMRLRERNVDRLRFLTRLAFTAGPGEWACIQLPSALSPLYRLIRVSRVSAKIVRRWTQPKPKLISDAMDATTPAETGRTSRRIQ